MTLLRRQPGTAFAVVTLLGLGIGINTSIFAVANTLLLQDPAGVVEPDRLVRLYRAEDGSTEVLSYHEFTFLGTSARTFSGVAAYEPDGAPVMLRAGSDPLQGVAGFASGNFFGLLGLKSAAGRLLLPEDDRPGAVAVAVISHAFWRRTFAASESIVGTQLTINGKPHAVIGVAPEEFLSLGVDDVAPDVWLPIWQRPTVLGRPTSDLVRQDGSLHTFLVGVGRLRPRATVTAAQTEATALAQRFRQAYPDDGVQDFAVRDRVAMDPGRRTAVSGMLRLLSSLSAVVLLIVCANLANLMLVMATIRGPEIAVRLSLGATRGQLVQQIMTETLVLAAAGTVTGLVLASWSADVLRERVLLRSAATPHIDMRVLTFAAALATFSALAFGLYPALRAASSARLDVGSASRVAGRRSHARSTLVVTQVALSFMLLVGAGLFYRSLQQVREIPLGFSVDRVLTFSLDLRPYGYTNTTSTEFFRQLEERVSALPGVSNVAFSGVTPLSGGRSSGSLLLEGSAPADGGPLTVDRNVATPGLFDVLGMPLRQGRDFSELDADGELVAIVNDAFVRRYWPGERAIGKRVRVGERAPWMTVVGVIDDARYYSPLEAPVPMLFRPLAQAPAARAELVVSARNRASDLIPLVRGELAKVDANVAVRRVTTLQESYERAISRFSTTAALVSLLGMLALLLAALGLYATVSFLVAQRTREIGVRLAIGARSADVLRMVLRRGATYAFVGLVAGALGAAAVTRLVTRLLYGVTPLDPVTYAFAVACLGAVMLLASAIPAARASRTDPLDALRHE